MTPIQLNREQWWLLCATYAAVLVVQRDNLREPNTATVFLIVGALLLAWRLNQREVIPADVGARRPVIAIISVMAMLSLAILIMSNWPSSQSEATMSSAASKAPPAPQGVTQQTDARTLGSASDGQAPISPFNLLLEFQANDFLAGKKYGGRFIRVVGEVVAVEGSPNEVAYLQLSLRPKPLGTVQALFPRNAEQIRGLKEGDRVTLSCSPRYDADVDNITLNDCSLVK